MDKQQSGTELKEKIQSLNKFLSDLIQAYGLHTNLIYEELGTIMVIASSEDTLNDSKVAIIQTQLSEHEAQFVLSLPPKRYLMRIKYRSGKWSLQGKEELLAAISKLKNSSVLNPS